MWRSNERHQQRRKHGGINSRQRIGIESVASKKKKRQRISKNRQLDKETWRADLSCIRRNETVFIALLNSWHIGMAA